MNVKDDLKYFLSLFLEYSLRPRAFLWASIMGRPSYSYYYYDARFHEIDPPYFTKLTPFHADRRDACSFYFMGVNLS